MVFNSSFLLKTGSATEMRGGAIAMGSEGQDGVRARTGESEERDFGADLCFRSKACLPELELGRLEIWFSVQSCVFGPGLA